MFYAKIFVEKKALFNTTKLDIAACFVEELRNAYFFVVGKFFSILCLTRDFIRQGHAREERKVYHATRTRSQAIDRG